MSLKYSKENTVEIIINNTTYVIYKDIASEIGLLKEIRESLGENAVMENINLEGIEHSTIIDMFEILTCMNVPGLGLKRDFTAHGAIKLINCMKFFLIDTIIIKKYIKLFDSSFNNYKSEKLLYLIEEFSKIPYCDSMLFLINELDFKSLYVSNSMFITMLTKLTGNNQFTYDFNLKVLSIIIESCKCNAEGSSYGGIVKLIEYIHKICGLNEVDIKPHINCDEHEKYKISINGEIIYIPQNDIEYIDCGIGCDIKIKHGLFRNELASNIAKMCLNKGLHNVLLSIPK
jgi:hypothetical protein